MVNTLVLVCKTYNCNNSATDESSHKHGTSDGQHTTKPPKIFEDNELSNMIDPILVSDDRNKDGFIDYYEFVAAQNAQVKASS